MKFKRVISAVAATAMLAGCFTGCGKEDEGAGKSADGKIELTLWSISTESDAFHDAYEQAIKDFEASHENVKIVHETFENESYKTKIKSAVAANELPDVFFTWAGGFSQSFVDSGKVLQLDDYYKKYESELSRAAVSNLIYDGKLYGSVMCTPISVMWYNQKLFDDNGIKVPENWTEFKDACQKFIDNGVTPIGTSAKDKWVLAMLHDALTLKSVGPEKLYSVLKKEGGSYSEADFLKSAEAIKELVDMGAFIEGAAGLSNDEASAEFYRGNAAMYFTGSWMGGSIMTDAENPADFSVAPIPVINSSNAKITDFMGGGSDSLMVAASTEHKDLSAELAFEITKGVSKYGYLSGAGIPAWKVTYDDSSVPELTKQVADYAIGATSFTLWFDTLMESEDAGEYLSFLQKLFVGSLSPKDFQSEMAKQLEK